MNLECFKLVFPWSFLFPTLGKWDDQFGIKWPPQSWLMGWFTIGFTTLDLKKIEGWCGTAVEACVAVSAIDIYTSRKWDEYIYIFAFFAFLKVVFTDAEHLPRILQDIPWVNHSSLAEDPPEPAFRTCRPRELATPFCVASLPVSASQSTAHGKSTDQKLLCWVVVGWSTHIETIGRNHGLFKSQKVMDYLITLIK